MLSRDATTAERGLMDLLAWEMFVADGVLRNVDGAFATTLAHRGPDLDSATAEELSALSRAVAGAVDLLGDGWLIHAEAQRFPARPYPAAGAFPDRLTRALDAERRERYAAEATRFETSYYLTLTYRPPAATRNGLRLLAGRTTPAEVVAREERQIAKFTAAVEEIHRQLAPHLRTRRMGTAEMTRYLYRALTCRTHPLQLPDSYPFTLESIFGAGDLEGGVELRLGEQHLVPVALLGLPDGTTPAALAFLDELPVAFRTVVRYLSMDRHTAKAAIAAQRRRWATAGLSIRDLLAFAAGGEKPRFHDRHSPRMAADADDALDELDRDQTSAGYLTATLVAFATERTAAREAAELLVGELRNAGFAAVIESYNAVEAYLGSLPAHGRYNIRRPIVAHRAFVDLASTTATWSGHTENPALPGQGPCLVAATRGSTPFFWSLAAGDVQHALVAGPTGAGKSVLVNTLIAQYLRYPAAQVFSLDRGWSQYVLCRAAGGCHYAPSAERTDGDRFAPLAHVDDPADLPHAADWLEDLLQLQGVEVAPSHRAAITRALELLAGARHRTLSTFAAKIQDTALREALAPYAEGGAFGHLFAATRSPLREGALHVIEMEALLPLRHKVLTPLVTHLFREIERRLDGRPTLIIVEEASQLLADSLFARRLREWLLELRKKNAGVVFVGQTLAGFLDSPLADALLENCPTRVFLPNGAARDPRTADAYRAFGLNDRQIDLVSRATPKRDYYVDTPDGSRMIQLDLSPGALAVLAAAGPRARDEADRLAAEHGAAWPETFLRQSGHDSLADLVTTPGRSPAGRPTSWRPGATGRPALPPTEEADHASV